MRTVQDLVTTTPFSLSKTGTTSDNGILGTCQLPFLGHTHTIEHLDSVGITVQTWGLLVEESMLFPGMWHTRC